MTTTLKGPAAFSNTKSEAPKASKGIVAPAVTHTPPPQGFREKAPGIVELETEPNPVPVTPPAPQPVPMQAPQPVEPVPVEEDVIAQTETVKAQNVDAGSDASPIVDETQSRALAQSSMALTEEFKDDFYENGVPVGMSNVDSTDVSAARWQIVQKTHDDILSHTPDAMGKFHHSASGEIVDKLTVVIMVASKSRSKFSDNLTGPRECYSYDAIRPHGGELFEQMENAWCDTCKFAKNGCTFMRDFYVVTLDQFESLPIPSVFSCSKGSLPPAENLNWFLKTRGVSPYFHVFEITTQEKKWGQGKSSYQPVFKKVSDTTPEQRHMCRQVALELENRVNRLKLAYQNQ